MTRPVLDFDDIAADDAMIESVRAGASVDELPGDDPVTGLLVSMRDGADASAASEPASAAAAGGSAVVAGGSAVVAGVVSHRRSIAVSVIAGVIVTAGVGTAVAGDPTAAFTYVFRQGVEFGSRLGTPGGGQADPSSLGRVDQGHAGMSRSSTPVRQGSSAARTEGNVTDHTGRSARDPMGFEQHSQYWTVPAPRGLESISGDRRESANGSPDKDNIDRFGDFGVRVDPTTRVPDDESESPGPDSDGTPELNDTDVDPDESTDPTPDDGPTTLTTPPPEETTSPPPEDGTTTPPPENETTTSPPPEDSTTTPPETTSPPPESTTPPPEETTSPPPEDSTSPSPSTSEPPSSPSPSSPTASESAQ